MNQDQIRGVLGQLKGKAKVIFGELTDNPDKKAEGSVDKLYGLLQEKFGQAKEQVKRHIDKVKLP